MNAIKWIFLSALSWMAASSLAQADNSGWARITSIVTNGSASLNVWSNAISSEKACESKSKDVDAWIARALQSNRDLNGKITQKTRMGQDSFFPDDPGRLCITTLTIASDHYRIVFDRYYDEEISNGNVPQLQTCDENDSSSVYFDQAIRRGWFGNIEEAHNNCARVEKIEN